MRRWLLAAALGLGLIGTAWAEAPSPATPRAEPADNADVVIDGRVLFALRGVTSFPAAARASAVQARIRELARNPAFDPAQLEVAEGAQFTRIGPQTRPVVRITDADAEFEGVDRPLYATICAERIRSAVVSYRASRTREALVSGGWHAAAATFFAAMVLFVLVRAFRALKRWVERRYREKVKTVTIRSFEVLRAERIWSFVHGAVVFTGGVAAVAVVAVYLRYALGLFPWTRAVAYHIDDWLVAPVRVLLSGALAKIPDLIFLAILFFVTRYALRLMRAFFVAVGRGEVELSGFEPEWSDPTYKIARICVVAFVLVIAYPYIPGSSSSAFQGVSIFLGVLLSLGSSSAIANLIAGYTMIYRRAFREGDVVKIGDTFGYVQNVRIQATHIRTTKNEEVIIPNSTILAGEVVNYSAIAKKDGLIVHTTVGIGYDTPWRQIEAMLLLAADRTERIAKEPKPFVLARSLNTFDVTYEVNGYCESPQKIAHVYDELHRHILDVFNEHGVQIMTPAYESDPEDLKVVPKDKFRLPPA